MLDLKAVFDGYDESRDGRVSLKEFGQVVATVDRLVFFSCYFV